METSTVTLSKITNFVKDKLKLSGVGYTFWTGIITGLLAHGFALTNKIICHSDIQHLFDKGTTVPSGRWFLSLMHFIFPNFSMPWIYGIITILFFTISACIVTKIFEIKNPILQGLVGALMVTFPCVTGTIVHMFTSMAYAAACLLATLGFFLIKDKFSYKTIIGIVCLAMSMGIYQAYMAIAASFAIIYLAEKIFDGKEETKDIVYSGIRILVSLILSVIVYYGFLKIFLLVGGEGLNGYVDEAVNNSEPLKTRIICMFILFVKTFLNGLYGLIPTTFSKVLHISCLAFIAVFVIIWLFKKNKIVNKLLMIALVIFYPVAVNALFITTSTGCSHILTVYSYSTVYLIAIIIIERIFTDNISKIITVLKEIGSVILACIVISNIYIANEAYLDLKLRYENVYSFYTQVITQVKMQPEFKSDTEIAIIGNNDEVFEFYNKFGDINDMRGIAAFKQDTPDRYAFIKYYIGFDGNFVEWREEEKLSKTDEFKQMPTYPDYGSIKCINDCIVVKLGDNS